MIPNYLRAYESGLKNFSLHFDKFSQWDQKLKAGIEHHTNAAATILKHADSSLRLLHKRQSSTLRSVNRKGGFCLEFTAKLATPYVSGLGGNHPTETGFILDRNTGLPYIPASAIKGVLRIAHTLNLADKFPENVKQTANGFEMDDTEPSLRKYFGDTDTSVDTAVRGQLVFLDAFPAGLPTVKKDIMNPHFGNYYKGLTPPTETENPIPVMFMTVKEGVEFKFRLFALPLAEGAVVSRHFDENDSAAIFSMVMRACEELGFGAKSAVGYGKMNGVKDSTNQLAAEWHTMEQDEENSRFPWRNALRGIELITTWGDFRQRILEDSILSGHKAETDVSNAAYSLAVTLRKGWKTEDRTERDQIIAAWLEPSGLVWPQSELISTVATNEAGAELERVKAITKWADYLAAPADMGVLSKNGLKQLRDKLKIWGCDAKDAREEKKALWEEVNRRMKA